MVLKLHNHFFASIPLIPFSENPPRTHLELKKLGLLLIEARENAHHGELWGVSVRGYQEEPITEFGVWLSIEVRSLRKPGFALDWVLSKRRGNSMIGCLTKSYQ